MHGHGRRFAHPGCFDERRPISVAFHVGRGLHRGYYSITGAISQEWMPHSRAMASSIVMGFAWGLGSLLIPPLGIIGDHLGLTCALVVVGALPLASLCFVSIIRKKEKAAILKEPAR